MYVPFSHGFPFDNAAIDNLDRNVSSDEFAEYLEAITGMPHGVYPNPSAGLQVTAAAGLTLTIGAGFCIIKGRIRRLVKDVTVSLEASENMDRIDRVIMRLDKKERYIAPAVLKGTAAINPAPPELTRDGDIYEIALANVRVTKLSTAVYQYQITDLRANTELCGYMPVFGSFDTDGLFNQYQDALDHFMDLVRAAMDDTAAGYLQGQIDDLGAGKLNNTTTFLTDLSSNNEGIIDDSGRVTSGILGTLPIKHGGTGASTPATALSNLGLTATAAELNYCDGVTSNIQGQLNGKQPRITGAASTVAAQNLPINRVLISDANGKISTNYVDVDNLNCLLNAHENIQNALDGKMRKTSWDLTDEISWLSGASNASLTKLNRIGNVCTLTGTFRITSSTLNSSIDIMQLPYNAMAVSMMWVPCYFGAEIYGQILINGNKVSLTLNKATENTFLKFSATYVTSWFDPDDPRNV